MPQESRPESVWLERVAEIHCREKSENCPAFCDEDGYQLTENFVEESLLHPLLEDLQRTAWNSGAIPKGIDVRRSYRCFRSFRRGAEITANNTGVSETVINFVHRWSKYEKKRGKQPGFKICWNITLTGLTPVRFSSPSLPVSESVGIQIGTDQFIQSTLVVEFFTRIHLVEGVGGY